MEVAYAVAPENDFAVNGLAQMVIPAGQAARARVVMEPRLAAHRQARLRRPLDADLDGWALLGLRDTTGA